MKGGKVYSLVATEEFGICPHDLKNKIHKWCLIDRDASLDNVDSTNKESGDLLDFTLANKVILKAMCLECSTRLEIRVGNSVFDAKLKSFLDENESRRNEIREKLLTQKDYGILLNSEFRLGKCESDEYGHHWHVKNTNENKTERQNIQANEKAIECCSCKAIFEIRLLEPIIPTAIIKVLENSRKKANNNDLSDFEKLKVGTRNYISTLGGIRVLATNAFKGDGRVIRADNEKAKARLGFDQAFTTIMQLFGFEYLDGVYTPPKVEEIKNTENIESYKLAVDQISLAIFSAQSILPDTEKTEKDKIKRIENKILNILGSEYFPRRSHIVSESIEDSLKPFSPSYATLGIPPTVSDPVILWAYDKKVEETPAEVGRLLDSLTDLSIGRKSSVLKLKVVQENTIGRYGSHAVKLAYSHFGTVDTNIDDNMLIFLFETECNDRPTLIETHKSKLAIIAQARKSSALVEFLLSIGHNENVANGQNPVGIVNIGNTCYLNSLLQYYYSIKNLREQVEEFGNQSTWNEQIMPGRKNGSMQITAAEIEKSISFISHLKRLFSELDAANSQIGSDGYKSIRVKPDYELAKMLLEPVNYINIEKDNDTNIQNTIFMPQQDITECMAMIESYLEVASPPSSADTLLSQRLFRGTLRFEFLGDTIKKSEFKNEYFNRLIINLDESQAADNTVQNCLAALFSEHKVDWYQNTDSSDNSDSNKATSADMTNSQSSATKRTFILELPEYLQIQVQRTQFDTVLNRPFKSTSPLKLLDTIDLTRFVHPDLPTKSYTYELYAIMIHEGDTTESGHYWIYIRNDEKNCWYEFNDDIVKIVSEQTIYSLDVSTKVYCVVYKLAKL